MPPVVVSVANFKGGVGKTTLAAVLAATLAARMGRRVLVVDLDPQANITEVFVPRRAFADLDRVARERGLVFSLDWTISSGSEPVVYDVRVRGMEGALSVVPSHPRYLGTVKVFTGIPVQRMKDFRTGLLSHPKFRDYDYVFIDLPPQMYHLVEAGLAVADYVVSPVMDSPFAVESLRYLIEGFVGRPEAETVFLGAVLTRFRRGATRQIRECRERVARTVRQAYSSLGATWPLDGAFEPSFDTTFYAERVWSNIRALPEEYGGVRLVKVLLGAYPSRVTREETRERYRRAVENALQLARELEERVRAASEVRGGG